MSKYIRETGLASFNQRFHHTLMTAKERVFGAKPPLQMNIKDKR
jgi:hypothetical protein